jgi:sugar lactone lactonase YvrE
MHDVLTRRRFLGLGAALGGTAALGTVGVPAWGAENRCREDAWPTTLNLPDGFHPGGIAIGSLPFAYAGSLLGGAIYRVNLATGEGTMIYPGVNQGHFDPRYMAVGLDLDRRGRLFTAGGWGDVIKVHDAVNGAILTTYSVGTANTAVYGTTVTPHGAWFTDGFNGLLYGVPFGPWGTLPAGDQVITLPLGGDWVQGTPTAPTASGIVPTPDGKALLVVNLVAGGGSLFRVDPSTGVARQVDIGGFQLSSTLGLALDGRTLYATPEQGGVTAIRLDHAGTSGAVITQITDSRFDVPSAAAVYGDRLYLLNSRFPLQPTPETKYNAVSVPLV